MLFHHTTFVGIDPTAGQRPIVYAALDPDLKLLALNQGELDEVSAFLGGQEAAVAAINAPRRPNQGLMKQEALRAQLQPAPRPGRWEGFRVAEYLLRQRNIATVRTNARLENCPNWMQAGFLLYQRLERLGYQDYPANEAARQMQESYPHAAFTVLVGRAPYAKTTLEGRLQRQLVLYERGLNIPDPMDIFEEITRYRILRGTLTLDLLYSPQELDALVAAYTAWFSAKNPGEVTLLGHPAEGQIVLPEKSILPKYP